MANVKRKRLNRPMVPTLRYKEIGRLVKTKREKIGLSQDGLALLSGVSVGFIGNIERGCAGVPKSKVKNFADALLISEEDIIEALLKDYKTLILIEMGLVKDSGFNGSYIDGKQLSLL